MFVIPFFPPSSLHNEIPRHATPTHRDRPTRHAYTAAVYSTSSPPPLEPPDMGNSNPGAEIWSLAEPWRETVAHRALEDCKQEVELEVLQFSATHYSYLYVLFFFLFGFPLKPLADAGFSIEAPQPGRERRRATACTSTVLDGVQILRVFLRWKRRKKQYRNRILERRPAIRCHGGRAADPQIGDRELVTLSLSPSSPSLPRPSATSAAP